MQLIGQLEGPFAIISGQLLRRYAMAVSAERLTEMELFTQDPTPLTVAGIRKCCAWMNTISLSEMDRHFF